MSLCLISSSVLQGLAKRRAVASAADKTIAGSGEVSLTIVNTARIGIKQGVNIVRREAETFHRKQAANAWMVKREAERKSPSGLDRKKDAS